MPALLAALALLAAPQRIAVVACAPGYPGSTAEAQPSMDAFAAALARAAGREPGSIAAVYHSTEKEGLARLAGGDAALAIVPLPFFVKHARALRLSAIAQVETIGVGASEVWTLVARKGRIAGPAALAGLAVVSIAGYAPDFVRGALGSWGRIPAGAQVVESSQVLSALRKAASGADVAVLLDGAQGAALPTLPFAADLEAVARSAPLPPALVAAVGSRLPAAQRAALERALLALGGDPRAAAALAGIRMARFLPVDGPALAAARKALEAP